MTRPLARFWPSAVLIPALLVALASCQGLRYGVRDAFRPDRTVSEDDPAAASVGRIFLAMDRDPDLLMGRLGRALAKLPEIADGPGSGEAGALTRLYQAARSADESGRRLLEAMARENPGSYQYGASLQALFQRAREGEITPEFLSRATRRTVLLHAWRSLPQRCPTPQAVFDYLVANYSYRINTTTAQPQTVFFQHKYGDCTEFSLLAGYLLHHLGYRVYILLSKPTPVTGHASVVFSDGDRFWLMDASRAVIDRALKKKEAAGTLTGRDRSIRGLMRPFDRIRGPAGDVGELVRVYERSAGRKVPFRLLDYFEYNAYIQAHGRENWAWWGF